MRVGRSKEPSGKYSTWEGECMRMGRLKEARKKGLEMHEKEVWRGK